MVLTGVVIRTFKDEITGFLKAEVDTRNTRLEVFVLGKPVLPGEPIVILNDLYGFSFVRFDENDEYLKSFNGSSSVRVNDAFIEESTGDFYRSYKTWDISYEQTREKCLYAHGMYLNTFFDENGNNCGFVISASTDLDKHKKHVHDLFIKFENDKFIIEKYTKSDGPVAEPPKPKPDSIIEIQNNKINIKTEAEGSNSSITLEPGKMLLQVNDKTSYIELTANGITIIGPRIDLNP
ncbi:MAG: hypothetical protein QXW35_04395 [Candidatus Aenigmatarchaeota archaeon]